jgi:hypothetical protein
MYEYLWNSWNWVFVVMKKKRSARHSNRTLFIYTKSVPKMEVNLQQQTWIYAVSQFSSSCSYDKRTHCIEHGRGYYKIKLSFWRLYWCVNPGHFTHKLNKSSEHFYVKFVSKMSRVYTSINSSKRMFNSYNSNSLTVCTQFQIFEKLPCTTLFEPFLAKQPTQLWNVTMKRGNVIDVILKRDVISLIVCSNLGPIAILYWGCNDLS